MIVTVRLEAGPPNWCASSADEGLGGVVAAVTGSSRAGVIREFKAALESHLQAGRDLGRSVPVIEGLDFRELVLA